MTSLWTCAKLKPVLFRANTLHKRLFSEPPTQSTEQNTKGYRYVMPRRSDIPHQDRHFFRTTTEQILTKFGEILTRHYHQETNESMTYTHRRQIIWQRAVFSNINDNAPASCGALAVTNNINRTAVIIRACDDDVVAVSRETPKDARLRPSQQQQQQLKLTRQRFIFVRSATQHVRMAADVASTPHFSTPYCLRRRRRRGVAERGFIEHDVSLTAVRTVRRVPSIAFAPQLSSFDSDNCQTNEYTYMQPTAPKLFYFCAQF